MAQESGPGEAEVLEPEHTNVPKSFLAFLAEQSQGQVVEELSRELRNLTEAIEMHFDRFRGKVTGEIGVKLKIILEGGAYKVVTEYKVMAPKAPASGTIMWLQPDGSLATR